MTFGEYSKTWEQTVLPLSKPATVVTVKAHLRKLGAICDQLLDAPVQMFFTQLSQELAPKSVRNIYATWHRIVAAALREDVISKIPVVALPRSSRPEQDWLTLPEIRRLVSSGSQPHPLYALLAETGLRIGEALGLQTQDLKGTSLKIARSVYNGQLQEPKTTAAKRTITISKHLLATLSDQLGSNPEDFIFRSPVGKPIWPDKLLRRMHQDMKDSKIRPMGFHAWRRGNASLCAGILEMPEKILAFRLGHELPGLTMGRYCQVWDDLDAAWAEKIGKAVFGK